MLAPTAKHLSCFNERFREDGIPLMIEQFHLPRQLQEELEGVDFHDSDIDMRQLTLPWRESGQEDGFDGLDEECVNFHAERVARESWQMRQEGVPELVGVGQGAEDRQFRSCIGGGCLIRRSFR